MAEKLIYDILKGKDNLTPALKNTAKVSQQVSKGVSNTSKAAKGAGTSFAALGSSIASLGPLAVAAGAAITTAFAGLAIGRAVEEAVALENALIGLSSVASSTGQDVQGIKDAAQELAADGLIPLTDVSSSLKNLLSTGLDAEESIRLFKSLRDAAAFNRSGQLELGEAIRGATEGIKNQNSTLIDNAGVTKNLSVIYKEYAASLGLTVGQLDDAQKSQAALVGITKEASIFTGDYSKLLETFSGAQSKAAGSVTQLFQEIGKIIIQSPEVIEAINSFSEGIRGLTKVITENAPAIKEFVSGFSELFLLKPSQFFASLFTDGERVSGNISVVTKELSELQAQAEQLQKAVSEPASDNFFVKFFQDIGRSNAEEELAKVTNRITVLQNRLKELRESTEDAETGTTGGSKDPANDPSVKFKQSVNKVLLDLERERIEAENQLQLAKDQAGEETGLLRLEALREQQLAEANIRQIAADEERARATKREQDLLAIRQNANNRKLREEISFAQKESEARKFLALEEIKQQNQRVQNFKSTLGAISTLSSSSNKELFAIGKAASIATATIDGIAAVQKALSSAPPPFNIALAAAVGAATAANVAKIASTPPPSFQDGGIVGGFNSGSTIGPDNTTVRARVGEAILNADQQKRLLDIADGKTGQSEDQIERLISAVNQPVVIELDGIEIARAMRDQVNGGFAVA